MPGRCSRRTADRKPRRLGWRQSSRRADPPRPTLQRPVPPARWPCRGTTFPRGSKASVEARPLWCVLRPIRGCPAPESRQASRNKAKRGRAGVAHRAAPPATAAKPGDVPTQADARPGPECRRRGLRCFRGEALSRGRRSRKGRHLGHQNVGDAARYARYRARTSGGFARQPLLIIGRPHGGHSTAATRENRGGLCEHQLVDPRPRARGRPHADLRQLRRPRVFERRGPQCSRPAGRLFGTGGGPLVYRPRFLGHQVEAYAASAAG